MDPDGEWSGYSPWLGYVFRDGSLPLMTLWYPLVNVYIAMENGDL